MLAASVSRKLRITALLKPAPATAGSRFSGREPRLARRVDQQRGAGKRRHLRASFVKRIDVSVGRQAQDIVDEACDRHPQHRPTRLPALRRSRYRPRLTPRTSASSPESTSPDGGNRPPAIAVDDAAQAASGKTPVMRDVAVTVTRANAGGHDALRLDGDDAWQAGQRVPGCGRSRLDERDRDVLPFGHRELGGDQSSMASMNTKPTTRIAAAKPMPTMEAAARKGWRAMLRSTIRPAVPRWRATTAFQNDFAGNGRAAPGASPRRVECDRAADGRKRAQARGRQGHGGAPRTTRGTAGTAGGEAEELVVEPDDQLPEPGARRDPDDHAKAADQQRPFHVVPGERGVSYSRAP